MMIWPSSRTVCRRGSTRVPRSRISSPSTDTLLDRIYSSQCRREPMPAAARNFCRRTRTCRGSSMGDVDDFATECFMATKITRIHEKRSAEFTLWRKLPENNRTELKPGHQVQSQISANQSPLVAAGGFRRVADRRLCCKNNQILLHPFGPHSQMLLWPRQVNTSRIPRMEKARQGPLKAPSFPCRAVNLSPHLREATESIE